MLFGVSWHWPTQVTACPLPISQTFYGTKGIHPVSHVTLLVRPGKFASGLDFSGGRFFPSGGRFILFRGALIFFQGGTFSPVKKARLNSGGLKPP